MASRVGVLMGGRSAEREISLRTGEQVASALGARGYVVTTYDTDSRSLAALLTDPPDCVFIALHGRFGEDGTVQGLLEVAGIAYTGSGVLASAMAMNKALTKRLFEWAEVPTPRWLVVSGPRDTAEVARAIKPPLVVKPSEEGSALGVSIVKELDEVKDALASAARYGSDIVVEEFVEGIELTVSVLGNDPPEALPIIEIVPKTDWYDFEAKYTPGMCDHVIPARIPQAAAERACEYALAAHKALGCRDISRVDMICAKGGDVTVLEVNTIPGLTPTSLFPDSARAAGISFEDLCERLAEMALARREPGAG